MQILIINFLMYASWFAWNIAHEKKITVYSFLILFYTSIALLGIITILNGIYYDTFGFYSLEKLELTPYLLAFITYLILLFPLRGIKCNVQSINIIFTQKTNKYVFIWSVVYTLYSILKLVEATISISRGLAATYDARHNDGITLFQYNPFLSKVNGYCSFFQDATVPFIMVYALLGVSKKVVSKKKVVFLIVLSFFPSIFEGIGMGTRGGLFMTFFCFMFFIFLFYESLPKHFVVKILQIGLLFVFIVLLYSWLITIDRVGESSGFDSILRYFGEAFPNLGFTVWNNATYHPMGERFFPEFFAPEIASLSTNDAYDFWLYRTNVSVLNFKTYYGDLYVEFGELGGIAFALFISIPFYIYLKKASINIYNIAYVYFYYQLCVFAFAGFTKTGWHSIFQLVIITVFTLYLKYVYKK